MSFRGQSAQSVIMSERFRSTSEEETTSIGRVIARRLPRDAVVHLTGDLGAGKTFLVKAIAAELGADRNEVSSPSFAIVHEYPRLALPPITHIDGYRLSDRRHEWEEIGIPEILRGAGLKLIEWPKEELRKVSGSVIDIAVTVENDDSRTIEVVGLPE
jgi:tRNA threonylcarbamoyladenosine biosynthesis protein TsaE